MERKKHPRLVKFLLHSAHEILNLKEGYASEDDGSPVPVEVDAVVRRGVADHAAASPTHDGPGLTRTHAPRAKNFSRAQYEKRPWRPMGATIF